MDIGAEASGNQNTLSAPKIQLFDTCFGAIGASVVLPIPPESLMLLLNIESTRFYYFGMPIAQRLSTQPALWLLSCVGRRISVRLSPSHLPNPQN